MIAGANDELTLPRIVLAAIPDFDLGGIRIKPARRQVCLPGGDCRDLEPRVMQVLIALARAGGEVVSRDALVEACWDGRIVGDDSLNRCVVALRHLARDIDPPPFAIETVARVGYSLVERETGAVDASRASIVESRAASAWRRPLLLTFAATMIGLAVVLAIMVGSVGSKDAGGPPAVRLGRVSSLSPELPATIAAAFREELIAAIEAEDSIMLIDAPAPAPGRGRPLALNTTVQKSGDRLRFTVHLTNERSGASIWSQRTELPVAFAALAPRQVAMSISQVLRCGLDIGPPLASWSDRQLALWLQYCQESRSEEPATPERVVAAARRVTRAAPDFSPGWSALAIAAMPVPNRFTHIDVQAQQAEAAQAATRALRLDPNNGDAYCARGLGLIDRRDWAGAEAMLRQAIAVRPSECACARLIYGIMLGAVGRFEDSLGQYRRLHDERPLASSSNAFLAEGLFLAGYADDAERVLAETLRLWPDRDPILTIRLRRAFWTGRYEDGAATLADPNFRSPPPRRAAFAAAFAALRDRRPESRAEAARLLKAQAEDVRENTRSVTIALAALGENRAAMASAERNLAYTRGVLFDPSFVAAQRDPAFSALVERLGMVRYWRQTRRPPDVCREAEAPAFCRALSVGR